MTYALIFTDNSSGYKQIATVHKGYLWQSSIDKELVFLRKNKTQKHSLLASFKCLNIHIGIRYEAFARRIWRFS